MTLEGDPSLVNALALAGGPTRDGNLRVVLVTRAGSGRRPTAYDVTSVLQGERAANPDLSDGDSVYVTQAKTRTDPRAIFAAILLEAKKRAKLFTARPRSR